MTEAENRPERTPEDAPDAAGLKRQLLVRAGVAASLIVVLLAGLAVYDRMHRVAPPPPAAPTVQALPPTAPPTVAEAGPAAAPAGEPDGHAETDAAPGRDVPPEPELASAPELAPPGRRQADAPAPEHGTPRLVLGGESVPPQPAHRSAARAASPEPPAVGAHAPAPLAPAAARPAAGRGYLVQVGFFTSPDNAEALRARLEQLGIPARLESRVVMGPFPDQAAARAAQGRLREAGESPGLIVGPRR